MPIAEKNRHALISNCGHLLAGLILFCCSFALYAAPTVEVHIEGVEGELLTNVQRMLSIEQQRDHPLLSAGRIKRLNQIADQEIRTALETYGYYRVKIDKQLQQVSAEHWRADYRIQLGKPLRLERVYVELRGQGRNVPELKKLFDDFPLRPGDVLNQVQYESAKSEIIQAATELGFFQQHFTRHDITIDLNK
jgi:translocation and assembly module TamA